MGYNYCKRGRGTSRKIRQGRSPNEPDRHQDARPARSAIGKADRKKVHQKDPRQERNQAGHPRGPKQHSQKGSEPSKTPQKQQL